VIQVIKDSLAGFLHTQIIYVKKCFRINKY